MGRSGNAAKRAAQERARTAVGRHGPEARSPSTATKAATGVHWGDPDQPVFGHGGWMIADVHRGQQLHPDELSVCGDLVMLQHEFYSWEVTARRGNAGAVARPRLDGSQSTRPAVTHGASFREYLPPGLTW